MKTITKKIKDFTVGEINHECRKHASCDSCPLHRRSYDIPSFCTAGELSEKDLNCKITLVVEE